MNASKNANDGPPFEHRTHQNSPDCGELLQPERPTDDEYQERDTVTPERLWKLGRHHRPIRVRKIAVLSSAPRGPQKTSTKHNFQIFKNLHGIMQQRKSNNNTFVFKIHTQRNSQNRNPYYDPWTMDIWRRSIFLVSAVCNNVEPQFSYPVRRMKKAQLWLQLILLELQLVFFNQWKRPMTHSYNQLKVGLDFVKGTDYRFESRTNPLSCFTTITRTNSRCVSRNHQK